MTDLKPLIFYDIPGNAHPNKYWSPNTQKTRYSLNYKGLPYETVWVEYPDIAALSEKIGAKSTGTVPIIGGPYYTLPIIYDPNTETVVADSWDIAEYLDRQYPEQPTLIEPGTAALQRIVGRSFGMAHNLIWDLIVANCNNQLNPRSKEYFRRTREEWESMKLEDVCPPGPKRVETMTKLEAALKKHDEVLSKHGNGKSFLMGDTPCFADFTFGGPLIWLTLLISEDERKQVAGWHNGRWAEYLEKLRKWEVGNLGDVNTTWNAD